jgi:membrane peptidoglycan carboxypeptidase
VNDHRNQRHRASEPAWPSGDDPDGARWPRHEEPQERTGFWSPLWEDDDDPPPRRPAGGKRSTSGKGHANGQGNGHHAAAPRNAPPRPQPPVPPSQEQTRPVRVPGPPTRPASPDATVALPRARRPVGAPPGQDGSDDPTTRLPHVPERARREPDLLTHREPDDDYDEDDYDDLPPSEEQRRRRRKKIWRRVRRTMYVFIVLMLVGPVLAFMIAYQMVTVPSPTDVKAGQNQVVTLQYANGVEFGRIAPDGANRRMVSYEELQAAPHVLNAIFAAEDATFMTNAGFDLSGVMRAGWNQLTGGTGGGSTITQQYIKQATGRDEATLTRKALEVVTAYKMNRTYSKEDIITAYLNTIYFGRNAYGIAAAAKSYYNKDDLKALTPSEAALLAGMIQSPSRFKDDEYMQRRWNYVMDQLVKNNWFPAEQRKAEPFPAPVPYEQTKPKALTGPEGLIQRAAYTELANGPLKLTEEDIQRSGFTIVTTVDQDAQQLAIDAVDAGMRDQPDNLRPALVAIDPKTGEIKAYYGGANGVGTNWAHEAQEPGSSFKPFDLVALLQKGKGLGEVYDGSSPRIFDGLKINNSDDAQCKECTVAEAMKRSINTVFYEIAVKEVGTQAVADAARQAGIPDPWNGDDGQAPTAGISIGGDRTAVSTVDMAAAYATFAARGMQRTPHIVAKVLNPNGSVYWEAQVAERQAFDADPRKNEKIARNVTEALLPVPGYSKIACADGRLCAGKTGTHQLGETGKNAKAWMVGYTPQISAAVSLSGDKGSPISDARGGDIFGAKVPGKIWKTFMDSYHKKFKLKKEDFGRFEPIGKTASAAEPSGPRRDNNNPRRGNGNGNGNGDDDDDNQPSNTRPRDQEPNPTTTNREPTRPSITLPTGGPGGPGEGDATG